MPWILTETTWDDVKAAKPEWIYTSVGSCWWTHRREDLRT